MKHKLLIIGLLFIAIAGLPLMVFFFQQQQDLRSRATAATTFSFTPSSSASTPIQKQIGDTVAMDIIVDPGTNAVSTVKMHISYSPNALIGTNASFTANTTAFPQLLEGPIIDTVNGTILVTVSVGADPTKAIIQPTKIGTITLTALSATGTAPTMISFGTQSQALSVGSGDQASENILATTEPAYIIINPLPTPTVTPTPTILPTKFSVTTFLHGIGNSGDNANPTSSSLSNKEPQHPTRNVIVSVFDSNNQLVLAKGGTVNYNTTNGNFIGLVDMGTALTAGNYTVKIKTDRLLQRGVNGIVTITPATTLSLAPVTLINGDADNNNLLNILDYNMLIGCYSDLQPPVSCTTEGKTNTDFNDDTNVNQTDYNLFLREISVQSGD